MSENRSMQGKSRGRGRGNPCPSAGAGGDNQTSTLNAEAPEFRPPVALMEHMHLDQARYGGHQSNFGPIQPSMNPMQYSRAVSGSSPQCGDAADLVQDTVRRIRENEKVSYASETLVARLMTAKGVGDLVAVAKTLTNVGANDDRTKTLPVFELVCHLAEKLQQPNRSFAQFMLHEMNERLVQWHRTCASNSGFVPQCRCFLLMLVDLLPRLAPLARGQQATMQLGLTIISFVHMLLVTQDTQSQQQALQMLMDLGPTLQDEMACDKEGPGAEANSGVGVASTWENLFGDIRRRIAVGHFANTELAINFIELLETRAANWGRMFHRQISNEGGLVRQNSEAMMDDEMYECYEKFLAETGQI